MSDNIESSATDAPTKRFQSYQSFQPVNDDKVKPPEQQSNTSLLSNSLSSNHSEKWTTERIRNLISNILTLISLGFLIPGLWYPMMTVHITAMGGAIEVTNQSRSILTTIKYLFNHGGYIPGILIVIFSIAIPFVKAILLLAMNVSSSARYNYTVYTIVRDWGKWSMGDVFVTSIFISFLSNSVIANIDTKLRVGFYCFLTYCIVSLLAVQVMCPPPIVIIQSDQEKMKTANVDRNPIVPNRVRDDNN